MPRGKRIGQHTQKTDADTIQSANNEVAKSLMNIYGLSQSDSRAYTELIGNNVNLPKLNAPALACALMIYVNHGADVKNLEDPKNWKYFSQGEESYIMKLVNGSKFVSVVEALIKAVFRYVEMLAAKHKKLSDIPKAAQGGGYFYDVDQDEEEQDDGSDVSDVDNEDE